MIRDRVLMSMEDTIFYTWKVVVIWCIWSFGYRPLLLQNETLNLARALGSRFVLKCSSYQSNLLNTGKKYEWLGCIGTKGGDIWESSSSIGFTFFAHALDLIDWRLLWWGENMCPEHYPELGCHHSARETILHADATQTGKCCDALKHFITLHTTEKFKHGTKGYIATKRDRLAGLQRRWFTFSRCYLILAKRESRTCSPCILVDYSRFH